MEVTAEVHFAQKLASNEKKYRDRALKRLQKYLSIRSSQGDGMSYEDFIKIWKGLHYCMWMQDKPLMQEELSERIANLLHSFPLLSDTLRFVNVFFITQAREWHLIDRFRIDKYMMMIRDVLHETFLLMSQAGWPVSASEAFSQYLATSIMDEDNSKLPDGLKLHMADIFMPELRKVSLEKMTGKKMTILMFPFAAFILKTRKMNLAAKVVAQTISPVLRDFGTWPNDENTISQQKDVMQARKRKTVEGDDEVDNDDGMEWDGSEEIDEESSETKKKKKALNKYDLSKLINLLFKMAESKKVPSKNRAMVYKVVQCYDNSFCLPNSNDAKESKVTVAPSDDQDEVSTQKMLELCWPGEEEKATKRKKRKRKKREFADFEALQKKEGEMEVEHGINDSSEGGSNSVSGNTELQEQTPSKKKKKRKHDSGNLETWASRNVSNREFQDSKSCDDQIPNKKDKKRKRDYDQLETSDLNVSKKVRVTNSPSSSSDSNYIAKNVHKGAEKIKDNKACHNGSPNTKLPTATTGKISSPKNKNSNAGSHLDVIDGNLILYSSMEVVKYPQVRSTNEDSKIPVDRPLTSRESSTSGELSEQMDVSDSMAKLSSASSESLSASSMTEVKVYMPSNEKPASKLPKKRKAKKPAPDKSLVKNDGPEESAGDKKTSGSGFLDTLTATPRQLVKKAMAMVLPATDPGPVREMVDKEEIATMTPGTKKKVVFNLKKNRANKFLDYIKAVQSDPSPVHLPVKSPSQSILKSPAPSPATSSLSLDIDSDTSDVGSPGRKGTRNRKKSRSGNKKTHRASQSPPKSTNQSPKASRKRSKSPRKKEMSK